MSTRVKRNRKKARGAQLVSNVELWKELHALLPHFPKLQRKRVQAHAGNMRNEKVDKLARREAKNQ